MRETGQTALALGFPADFAGRLVAQPGRLRNFLPTETLMALNEPLTMYMGLVDAGGGLQLYDGKLRLSDRTGKVLDEFDPQDYLDYIGEHVEEWSYLNFPFYKKMGWPKGVYRVGPLGRLNVADKINTPMANEEFKNFKSIGGGKPVEGTLWYHYARLIEDLYAVERAKEILLDPDVTSTDIATDYAGVTGEGVGCIEAPRGTLFHHYKTDSNGMLTKVNLIVATGHNNWIIVSVCFSLFHFINNSYEFLISAALGLFVAGLLFTWVRETTGGLWIPIGIHFAWDAASSWFNLLARQSPHLIMTSYTVPTWLVGEFGVSDWVMLFIFAASVWVYKSRVGASMNIHNALKSQSYKENAQLQNVLLFLSPVK